MNIKKALEVIDQKTEYIRKNTYSARGEDTIRVKLSDLRAVIEALGFENETKPLETQSIESQGNVSIGLNREKLASEIFYSLRPDRNEPWAKMKCTDVENHCYLIADAIIAQESDILEVRQ